MSETKPVNPPILTGLPDVGVWTNVTLRDIFAAAALAGQEANPNTERSYEATADVAYQTADAMLREREES